MKVFALDSNIVSYLLKNSGGVAEKINAEIDNGNQVVIPAIVYYEVRRGLLAIDAPAKTAAFVKLCEALGIGTINADILNIAAIEHARLRKIGQPVDDADLLIAAECVHNGYTLVTNNTKHFDRIEKLEYVNWIE